MSAAAEPDAPSPFIADTFFLLQDLHQTLEPTPSSTPDDSPFSELLNLLALDTTPDTAAAFTTQLATLLSRSPSSPPHLLPAFTTLLTTLQTSDLQPALTRLCESYFIHTKVHNLLTLANLPPAVFTAYLAALQLDHPHVAHSEVWDRVWNVFERHVPPPTRAKLRVLFAEVDAVEAVGLDEEVLREMRGVVGDEDVYREVLAYLEMLGSCNLHWDQVFEMIESMVLRRRPEVWPDLLTLLSTWREELASDFLEHARDFFEDEELYEDFRIAYLAEPELTPEEVLEKIAEEQAATTEGLKKKLRRLSALQRGGGGEFVV